MSSEVMMMADRNVAVLRDSGLPDPIRRILVPVGSGPQRAPRLADGAGYHPA